MHHVLPLSLRRRRPGRIRPRLEPLCDVLETLHNPQSRWPSILVVGTNGKGSAAAMTGELLASHGAKVGIYTSPHLVTVEERIRIGGRKIERQHLERHLETLDAFPQLTFFETLTAAAFLAFSEAGVDVAVLEAGMGGRWDATRAASSAVAGLTNVGTDHSAWLGKDRAAIAADKGAALAAARLAVVSEEVDQPTRLLLGAPAARRAGRVIPVTGTAGGRAELRLHGELLEVQVPLAGSHQVHNLGLAMALTLCAAELGWIPEPTAEKVRSGLAQTRWPGRLSRHRIGGREVLIDCAHNREGAVALAHYLQSQEQRYNLLFSCLDDKPVAEMAALLQPVVAQVALCTLEDERAMAVGTMASAFTGAFRGADPLTALDLLPDPVVAAGSLRLVGALLATEEEK